MSWTAAGDCTRCSLPTTGSLSGWGASCRRATALGRRAPLPWSTPAAWCSRDTAPSPPSATVTAAPDGRAWVNVSGNPGMAKGGSGDVLAGLILSLLGQGLPARQAVPMAVWLHGEAGEVCARAIGEYGMTPTDVIAALPAVIEEHVS